jgi:hypothetical protein
VFDVYNASGNATAQTTVFPSSGSTSTIVNVEQQLTLGLINNNPTAIMQTIATAVYSINSVDCTVPISCNRIKRFDCVYTEKTCGECFAGYIGPLGDSNVPCNLPTKILNVDEKCTTNTSCSTGFCFKQQCKDVAKSCPNNNCDGNGKCTFFNKMGKIIFFCSIFDSSCTASCVCNANRFGSGCSLTLLQFKQLSISRETLCDSTVRMLSIQDVSLDVVISS